MLKAVLGSSMQLWLVNPEIVVTGKSLSNKLCRETVNNYPLLAKEQVEVYRNNDLIYTIQDIKHWAKYDLKENDTGIHKMKHKEFNNAFCN